jgi:4-amino-4-deoxy-L-arabinose transferase-like glycosyltransferase
MKELLNRFKLSDYQRWLLWIVVLAVLLRFAFYVFVYLPLEQDFAWYLDDNYDRVAANLLAGYGYVSHPGGPPEMYRRPLYVLFLAGIYSLFGEDRWILTLIQTLLQGLTCLLIFLIAKENFKHKTIGLLSALGFALYPQPMLYVGRPFTEGLYIPMVAVFVLWYARLFRELSMKNALYTGISLGVLNLIRPTMQPFFVVILLGLLIHYVNRRREVMLKWAVVTCAMFLVMSPWLIRNYLASADPAPAMAQFSKAVLYNALMKPPTFVLVDQQEERLRVARQIEALGLSSKLGINSRRVFKVVLLTLMDNFPKFLKRMFFESMFFWYLGCSVTTSLINLAVHLPLLILGLGGMYLARGKRVLVLPFLLLIVYFNLIHSFMAAGARLAFPVVPYLIIFSVYALFSLYQQHAKTREFAGLSEGGVYL